MTILLALKFIPTKFIQNKILVSKSRWFALRLDYNWKNVLKWECLLCTNFAINNSALYFEIHTFLILYSSILILEYRESEIPEMSPDSGIGPSLAKTVAEVLVNGADDTKEDLPISKGRFQLLNFWICVQLQNMYTIVKNLTWSSK